MIEKHTISHCFFSSMVLFILLKYLIKAYSDKCYTLYNNIIIMNQLLRSTEIILKDTKKKKKMMY